MNHDELYKNARIYDVAFNYRDFGKELDFLTACAVKLGGGAPTSFLEVAAGPGVHALLAAERGMRVIALDLAPAMMELCAMKARARNLQLQTMVADMARFDVDTPVDLAFNPLTSISYLRTLDQLAEHMRCMARAVVPGGIYVVENNHPKDFLKGEHFTPSIWTMSEDDMTVTTTWIAQAPPNMDAAAQTYEAVGRYEVAGGPTIEDRAWLRMTFPSEIGLCARLAGFDVVAELGDLDLDKPLDDSGWRAVVVLKRRL
ncbi:MAG TPA: class I SAM-dependent methyltransferase [Myxococcota bacterium]